MSTPLANAAARSLVWSIGGQATVAVVQIVTYSVLARLITPEDFGLVAMVLAIIGFGEIVRDFGLTNASIQAKTLSEDEQNNLFWTNTVIGGLIGGLLWFTSGLVADFYGSDQLAPLTQALAITFLINGFAAQPRANLTRALRTKDLAIADITGVFVGMTTAIIMAQLGYGYWAIVGMQLGRLSIVAVLMFILARFLPTLPKKNISITRFLRFGAGMLGSQTMILAGLNSSTILIGRSLGAAQLGFFSRAQNLATVPMANLSPALARVILPVFSRLHDDQARFEAYVLRTQTALLLFLTLLYSGMFVFADILIRLFLGPNWDNAILPFRILCLYGIIEIIHFLTDWIFISRGHTSQFFRYALLSRLALVFMVALAAEQSISWVAWAILIWGYAFWPVGLVLASNIASLPLKALFLQAIRTFFLGGVVIAAGAGIRTLTAERGIAIELSLSLAACILVTLAVFGAIRPLREDIRSILALVMMLRRGK